MLKHLEAKGTIAAMTKAASYLLSWDTFSMMRDYLIEPRRVDGVGRDGRRAEVGQAGGLRVRDLRHVRRAAHPGGQRRSRRTGAPSSRREPKRELAFRFGYYDKKNREPPRSSCRKKAEAVHRRVGHVAHATTDLAQFIACDRSLASMHGAAAVRAAQCSRAARRPAVRRRRPAPSSCGTRAAGQCATRAASRTSRVVAPPPRERAASRSARGGERARDASRSRRGRGARDAARARDERLARDDPRSKRTSVVRDRRRARPAREACRRAPDRERASRCRSSTACRSTSCIRRCVDWIASGDRQPTSCMPRADRARARSAPSASRHRSRARVRRRPLRRRPRRPARPADRRGRRRHRRARRALTSSASTAAAAATSASSTTTAR